MHDVCSSSVFNGMAISMRTNAWVRIDMNPCWNWTIHVDTLYSNSICYDLWITHTHTHTYASDKIFHQTSTFTPFFSTWYTYNIIVLNVNIRSRKTENYLHVKFMEYLSQPLAWPYLCSVSLCMESATALGTLTHKHIVQFALHMRNT